MKNLRCVLRLTRSQQMALSSILLAYCSDVSECHEFVDVIADVTTTSAELLALVIDCTREIEMVKP